MSAVAWVGRAAHNRVTMAPVGRALRRVEAAALAVLIALAGPGCRALRGGRDAAFEPVERRVDVVAGSRLVLPIEVRGMLNPARPIRATMDDGTPVPAELWWVNVAPGGRRAWLPPAGAWSATPASSGVRPAGEGSWCLILDLPRGAIGQGVWVNGRRVALRWLPDPAPIIPPGGDSPLAVPREVESAVLMPGVDAERDSPLLRWRHRLLTRGLDPPRDVDDAGVPPADRFEEPALEALAAQVEARWRSGLVRLWRADAITADAVRRRLLLTARFGPGVIAPVWPCAGPALDRLLEDLLRPGLSDAEAADRARAWLEDQPPAVAWVIDDAGTRDGVSSRSVATIGVVNLEDRRTLAWVESVPGETPDLSPIDPCVARRFSVPVPPGADVPPREPAELSVHVGRWGVRRAVAGDPVPVRPPGRRLDPFFADWGLPEWLAGRPEALAVPSGADWSTAALLLREAGSNGSESWVLHVECRAAAAPRAGGDEVVRVWIGPFERARHVLRVTLGKDAVDLGARGTGEGRRLDGVTVVRLDDRWVCRVPLPDGSLELDGTLMMGLERMDARGVHSAWPRPMLPWQFEPGRLALDAGAWDRLVPATGRR